MHELQTAMDKHQALVDHNRTLIEKVKELENDVTFRDGEISKLEEKYKDAIADRDYYLRWAIEVTKTIFDIGIFVNETINTCRGVVGNNLQATIDPKRNEAILKGVEDAVMKRPAKPKLAEPIEQAIRSVRPRDLDAAAE